MIDSDTRLRVARGIAKTETEAAQQVFQTHRPAGRWYNRAVLLQRALLRPLS